MSAAAATALLIGCSISNIPKFLSDVSAGAPVVALANVRVIDGTGAAGTDDQTIVIESGPDHGGGALRPRSASRTTRRGSSCAAAR